MFLCIIYLFEVWVFWEGDKIWKNLRRTFDKSVVFCAFNSVLVKKSMKKFRTWLSCLETALAICLLCSKQNKPTWRLHTKMLTTFGKSKSGNTGVKPLSLSATRHDFPVPTPRRCCGLLCYCSNQLTSFVSSFKEIWLSSFFAKKLFSQKYFLLKT